MNRPGVTISLVVLVKISNQSICMIRKCRFEFNPQMSKVFPFNFSLNPPRNVDDQDGNSN